jgi:hypothetical protein
MRLSRDSLKNVNQEVWSKSELFYALENTSIEPVKYRKAFLLWTQKLFGHLPFPGEGYTPLERVGVKHSH